MRDYPARGRCTTARNKYEKSITAAAGVVSFFVFAYLAFVSCYVSPSVVVPAAYVTGRWCRMVVIVPLHYIYNMTNNLKNKNHFFKGAGLRPSASGERHEIIQPSFGLTYNMLKNSKSVMLFCSFCYFFQKKIPRLSPNLKGSADPLGSVLLSLIFNILFNRCL